MVRRQGARLDAIDHGHRADGTEPWPHPEGPTMNPLNRLTMALSCALALAACGGGGGGSGDSETGGSGSGSPNPVPALGSYAVVAWNDLGMHCVDGKDYAVFSILPPYNNLNAQVLRRDLTGNKLVSSGISLSYEAVADANGSINTASATKTNFWAWVQKLFGATPASDVGLTGNPTPSATPAALSYNTTQRWWEATGIPITPYDDSGAKNYYPMVKVVARDASGSVLASTRVVLPVSDEMSCKTCHASDSSSSAARPAAGWVNDGADAEKDWKKNILRLHDEKHPSAITRAGKGGTYPQASLLASALAGQPVLCAGCHQSNALGTAVVNGIPPLTTALHARHAQVLNPANGATLEADATRSACYLCHPGSVTKCLRGVMGNAVDANGQPSIDCQSCHGPMSSVGRAGRDGWLDEPTCQNCHDRASASAPFSRFTSVFSSGTTVRSAVDARFATTAGVPVAGKSLYRYGTGHGGVKCEACHGATHAEYPSSHANDNAQSIALQGYAGTMRECATCHASVPLTTSGGPHGMHTIGASWVKAHGDRVESSGSAACATCHGSGFRGSPMSRVAVARSYSVEHGTVSFAAGQAVGCYDCHNGPGH
jgi:hypothetical protein